MPQCCDDKIQFAIIEGGQPLPIKNNKSLKVSVSEVVVYFFQNNVSISLDQIFIG